jgi:tetratricopeptide (TPR) repeat protein
MGSLENALSRVQDALRRSQFRRAVTLAVSLPKNELEPEQLSDLMNAMLAAAVALSDGSRAEVEAYDLIIDFGKALSHHDIYKTAAQLKTNSALFNKGVVLAQLGRPEEAIAAYDELVRRAGGSRDSGLRRAAVKALFNKGASLAGQDRLEDAIAVYDELVRRFAGDPEPGSSEAVGKALINKGIALAELDRLAEAVAVLDEVVRRWGDSPDPVLRERTSKALLNKASALLQLRNRQRALETYEEILTRFGADTEPMLRRQVEIARHSKATLEASIN